jgi:hypothetical protein
VGERVAYRVAGIQIGDFKLEIVIHRRVSFLSATVFVGSQETIGARRPWRQFTAR